MTIPLPSVNEKTTLLLTVAFFDEDDVAVVPTSATYRIDRPAEANSAVLAATAITGLATTKTLTITSAQNAIVGSRAFQEQVVTVEFDYGSPSKHGTDEYRYRIKALPGVA